MQMATRIVHLNAYRRVTVKAPPGTDCGKVRTGTRKNAAMRQTRNRTAAPVLQIPTKANKKQRCEAAAARHGQTCQEVARDGYWRTIDTPIAGVMVITATDPDGGDGGALFGGVYAIDPDAALCSLRLAIEHFEEKAHDLRNVRAMAAAQPVKRPAFEVAL
jgi:hypothetical protein